MTDKVQMEFVKTFDRKLDLDGMFNTIRMGSKWANLVTRGDVIDLVVRTRMAHSADTVETIGQAEVLHVTYGPVETMILLHAGANFVVDKDARSAVHAINSLHNDLESVYGSFDGDSIATVVYLKRL